VTEKNAAKSTSQYPNDALVNRDDLDTINNAEVHTL